MVETLSQVLLGAQSFVFPSDGVLTADQRELLARHGVEVRTIGGVYHLTHQRRHQTALPGNCLVIREDGVVEVYLTREGALTRYETA